MKSYGFISRDEFFGALDGTSKASSGVILTFDDSFVDHYEWVFPELGRRGLWGIFYVPTAYYETGMTLDVHRIHQLLGRCRANVVLEALRALLEDEMICTEYVAAFEALTYWSQTNDEATTLCKRILNYYVKDEHRTLLLDALMETLLSDADIGNNLYMTPQMLRAMHESGMTIGSHGVSHRVFSKLSETEQRREIVASFERLDEIVGGLAVRTFCYPFGGFHTFDATTERLLVETGCRFAFNVEPRDIDERDLRERPLALPRYGCNQFAYGQSRPISR